MKIDVSNLAIGDSLSISYEAELIVPKAYLLNKQNVKVNINATITKFNEYLAFEGEGKTILNRNCDSCLLEVDFDLTFSVFEKFCNYTTDLEDAYFFDGRYIEPNDAVLSNLLANIPIMVVCSQDCKGLCPSCGINLNTNNCDCSGKKIDQRFAGLNSFFKDREV